MFQVLQMSGRINFLETQSSSVFYHSDSDEQQGIFYIYYPTVGIA